MLRSVGVQLAAGSDTPVKRAPERSWNEVLYRSIDWVNANEESNATVGILGTLCFDS